MEIIYRIVLIIHVLCGFTALSTGIVPMIAKKGGRVHNMTGRWYFWAMFGVFVTTILMFSMKPTKLMLQFFLAVSVASFYQTFTGYRALLGKKQGGYPMPLDRFAAWTSLIFGFACFGYAGYCFGILNNTSLGILFTFFSVVCAGNAFRDLRTFYGYATPQKMHWFFTHIGRMVASYGATLTAFLVNMSRFFPEWTYLIIWILPGMLSALVSIYWIRSYKKRMNLLPSKPAKQTVFDKVFRRKPVLMNS
jgi:uncharacterized membrane protein